MAKRRQPTREEIEQEAAAELNRSVQRSLASSESAYPAPARPVPRPEEDEPPQWTPEYDESSGWDISAEARLSAAEEEEAVTGLAIQQLAERWGRSAPEDHIIARVHPSQAEEARDRALREAVARQARFAKPVRRVPVPTQTTRGFSSSWTNSSPGAASSEPMVWESAMPITSAAEKAAPAKKAPAKKAPAKKAPAKKTARKGTAARKRTGR